MIRPALAIGLMLALTGCERAARESDNPRPAASAGTAAPAAFAQCAICHTTAPGKHLIGPSLAGIYGRPAAAARDYPYSAALQRAGLTWDEPTLDRFLAAPMTAVPGTRMTYAGIADPAARRAIVAYLKTL